MFFLTRDFVQIISIFATICILSSCNSSQKKSYSQYGVDESWTPKQDDVSVGMTTRDVIHSWGQPSDVQWAGNPVQGNQKWTYQHLDSKWGMAETRTLYFERGKLVGWSTTNGSSSP